MSTPWGIELNEDILAVIEDNLFEFHGDQSEDGPLLGLRDGLAPQRGLELAGGVFLEEGSDGLSAELLRLVEGILHLSRDFLDDECGPLANSEVHRLAMFSESVGVNPGKVDLASVFLSEWLERLDESVLALVDGVNEEVCQRTASIGVDGVVLAINLLKERNSVRLQPCAEGGFVDRRGRAGVDNLWLIESPVNDDSGLRDTSSLSECWVGGVTEQELITVSLGVLSITGGGGVSVENDDDLVTLDEFGVLSYGNSVDRRKGLPIRNGCKLSARLSERE